MDTQTGVITRRAVAMNGTVPGPLIRLRDGDGAVLRVTTICRGSHPFTGMDLILPPDMDGVHAGALRHGRRKDSRPRGDGVL